MPPVPSVRGERIVRALERAGFKVARVAGSHHIMRHPDGRGTTVPVHPGRDVAKGAPARAQRRPYNHGTPSARRVKHVPDRNIAVCARPRGRSWMCYGQTGSAAFLAKAERIT
jgi:predicted RNA binding protein YcfA (HicA-like mRNA interferase family)